MTSKTSRATNFSKQEKLLLAELGKDLPEVESKGYDSDHVEKIGKSMGGDFNLTWFLNS